MKNIIARDGFRRALIKQIGWLRGLALQSRSLSDGEKVEYIAGSLGKDIETLTQELANSLRVPYLASVPSLSCQYLPRKLGISELRQFEFVPLFDRENLVGFAAVNPYAVRLKYLDYAQLPIFMSSPRSVRNALTRSEIATGSFDLPHRASDDVIAIEIVSRIAAHAQSFSQDKFYIKEIDGRLAYEVRGSQAGMKRGFISNTISEGLLRICAEYVANRKCFLLEDTKISYAVTFSDEMTEYVFKKIEFLNQPSLSPKLSSLSETLGATDDGAEVLLIDDNRDFLRVLERFLTRAGFKVTCLASSVQAIRHLEIATLLPQAIVTDLHLPELDGLKLVEILGARFEDRLPPILFLTSEESIESEIGALKRGALAFIPKSRDPRLLVAYLENVCRVRRFRMAA